MARGWKIFMVAGGVAIFAALTLPWWLAPVLRPVLRAQGITFERYERVGYARFRLSGVHYRRPGLAIDAETVESDTPVRWAARRINRAEPELVVTGWTLTKTPDATPPTSARRTVAGMADLHRLLMRLVPIFDRWLPRTRLVAGELRGITPPITIGEAEWHDATLQARAVGVAGYELLRVVVAAEKETFTVIAQTADEKGNLLVHWNAQEIAGDGGWWNQPLKLRATYGAEGWLPVTATATAQDWLLPAERMKLGAPYVRVRGHANLEWGDGAFTLAAEGRAEAEAGASAPAFEAQAAAQGTLQQITLNTLHVDAPFVRADLSAPVTLGFKQPLAQAAASLTVHADLAKLPWLQATGRVDGQISLAGDSAVARQTFALDLNDIEVAPLRISSAKVTGALEWPVLRLDQAEARLDDTSVVAARGAINWQTRELVSATLEGKVGPAWFQPWLPAGMSWTTAEIALAGEGPLNAPAYRGSLTVTDAKFRALHPLGVTATWQGVGSAVTVTGARATASGSSLQASGTLSRKGARVTALAFTPSGEPTAELAAPFALTWGPEWRVERAELKGPARSFAVTAHGGPTGAIEVEATHFKSAWLEDWLTLTGPRWTVHRLHTQAQLNDGLVVFETALTGEIAMQPQPAQLSVVARGDRQGVELTELTVKESNRVLTQVTGRVPVTWKTGTGGGFFFDEGAAVKLSATTDPDSPLWSLLSGYTGIRLAQPTARLAVTGTLRQPVGEFSLQASEFATVPDRFKVAVPIFDDLKVALTFDRDAVVLSNLSTQLDGQALTARARLPMDDAHWTALWQRPQEFDWSQVSGQIEIPSADLAVLARRLPNLVAPKGRLQAKVEMAAGGKLSGRLQLTDAAARPLPPFSTLQEVNAELVLNDRTLTVQTLTGKLGGEPVAIGGTVTLGPDNRPRLALGLKGSNLPLVRNTGLLVRNDIDLHADTDAQGVTRLTGTVTLRDCLVLANLGALLPTGQKGVTRQPPYFAVDAEPFRTWPLAIEVRGPQAIRIRTTVFNGTASARFQLGGTLGEPRAVGEVTVDRGQVLFPFATFTVQQGTLRLREADPFHAVVNVNATSQRRDYQLRLEATGQLPTPNIALTSTPALEAEEVLLMVMTGQPPNSLEVTASSAGQRLALLGAYLGRGIFEDLGLSGEDRLEINAGEQVSVQGRETYDFEYKLGRRWSLTGEYDRFDTYNAGVKYRLYTEESKPVEK